MIQEVGILDGTNARWHTYLVLLRGRISLGSLWCAREECFREQMRIAI
jgi:hypothetical protein